jgi:hypothetical protein
MAKTVGLTPWKGGGFGMFSTLDHGAIEADILIEATERSDLNTSRPRSRTALRAANCPAEWPLRDTRRRPRERRYERPVTRAALTVWRTRFDPSSLAASDVCCTRSCIRFRKPGVYGSERVERPACDGFRRPVRRISTRRSGHGHRPASRLMGPWFVSP